MNSTPLHPVSYSVNLVLVSREKRNAQRKILLQLRDEKAGISFPGYWALPGGRSEAVDQSPIDAVIREFHEETGKHLHRHSLKLLTILETVTADNLKLQAFFFFADILGLLTAAIPCFEGQRFEFHSLEQIKSLPNFIPYQRDMLENLLTSL